MKSNLVDIIHKKVTLVTLFIFSLCLYPILVLILVPLLTYRWIARQLARLNPKIGPMLTGADALFAAHNTYTKPTSTALISLTVSSKVDIKHVINVLNERIFKLQNENSCIYPELMQKIVRIYGYNFWHQVDDFAIENHVNCLNPSNPNELVCQSELHSIISEDLVLRPFDSSRSPWELIIVPNYLNKSEPQAKSLLLFRFHHCLIDGYSFINFWQKLSIKLWKNLGGTPKTFGPNQLQRIVQYLKIFLTGPYHSLNMIFFSDIENHLKVKYNSTHKILHKETTLPMSIVTNVKNQLKVSFSSVIIAMFAEGVKETLLQKRIIKNSSFLKIHMGMPGPLPGHPDRLTNHMSFIRLPVTIYMDDPVKTVQNIHKEYEKYRRSVKPLLSVCRQKIIGSLPVRLIPQSVANSTCLLTNFPGPSEEVDVFGYPVVGFKFIGTPPPGHGFALAALSYNGCIRLNSGTSGCYLTSQHDADFLNESMKQTAFRLQEEVRKDKKYL